MIGQDTQSMKDKIFFGTTTGTVFKFIGVLIGFVTVPLILKSLGVEMYGVYTLLVSVTGFLGFTNFGLTTALTNEINYLRTDKKWNEINKIFSSVCMFFLVITLPLVLLISAGLYTDILDLSFFLKGFEHQEDYVRVVLSVLLIFAIFRILFIDTVRALYHGVNMVSRYNTYNIVWAAFYGVVLVIFLFTKPTLLDLIIFQGLSEIIRLVIFIYLFKRMHIWFRMHPRLFAIRDISLVAKSGMAFFILSITTSIILKTDHLLLSHYIGVSSIAVYAIGYKLFKLASDALPVATAAYPLVAGLHQEDDVRGLQILYHRTLRLNMIVKFIPFIFICLYARQIITLWVGADLFYSQLLVVIFFFSFVSFTWSGSHWLFINAMSLHKTQVAPSILEATLNIALSVLFVQVWGLVGVALGTVVANMITVGIYLPYTLKKYIPIQPVKELFTLVIHLSIPVAVLVMLWSITMYYMNIWGQIITAPFVGLLFVLLIYRFVFDSSEKETFRTYIRRFLKISM
ncbi:MAG TPA: hypothetical protein DCS29_00935 [Candidatus Magasanikbacteria bacterium]|nr:MAG: hypothetical protein A2479_04560 [Candidatus Magasanikbacteria bacterium RIFOXYC2_FULL_39_8]HAT03328.1 hypothetical protein [Candidatus Magasanikbacteria bacterium]